MLYIQIIATLILIELSCVTYNQGVQARKMVEIANYFAAESKKKKKE